MCSAAVVAKLFLHDSAVVDDELAKATVQQVLLETILWHSHLAPLLFGLPRL